MSACTLLQQWKISDWFTLIPNFLGALGRNFYVWALERASFGCNPTVLPELATTPFFTSYPKSSFFAQLLTFTSHLCCNHQFDNASLHFHSRRFVTDPQSTPSRLGQEDGFQRGLLWRLLATSRSWWRSRQTNLLLWYVHCFHQVFIITVRCCALETQS